MSMKFNHFTPEFMNKTLPSDFGTSIVTNRDVCHKSRIERQIV